MTSWANIDLGYIARPNPYENMYELTEALALFQTHGKAIALTYDYAAGVYRFEGNVDGKVVAGCHAEPHAAANIAWAKCYKRTSLGDLMGVGHPRKPKLTVKSIQGRPGWFRLPKRDYIHAIKSRAEAFKLAVNARLKKKQ